MSEWVVWPFMNTFFVQYASFALSAVLLLLWVRTPRQVLWGYGLAVVILVDLAGAHFHDGFDQGGIRVATVEPSQVAPNLHAVELARDLAPDHQRIIQLPP